MLYKTKIKTRAIQNTSVLFDVINTNDNNKVHCIKFLILPNFLLWKFYRNAQFPQFPQNLYARKVGEILVAVVSVITKTSSFIQAVMIL